VVFIVAMIVAFVLGMAGAFGAEKAPKHPPKLKAAGKSVALTPAMRAELKQYEDQTQPLEIQRQVLQQQVGLAIKRWAEELKVGTDWRLNPAAQQFDPPPTEPTTTSTTSTSTPTTTHP
jgi:hypothetical protein